MEKIWQVAAPISQEEIKQFPKINPVILQLLFNRGLKEQAAVDKFLAPNYDQDLHSPFLFLGMETAVTRINQAIAKKERVLVYGDYDVDGVCSAVLLISVLRILGLEPDVYIPDREVEGYGLAQKAIADIIKLGVKLIITVDCGIANYDEIEFLNQNGVEVIVTDHHQPVARLPNAVAVINPKIKNQKYPFAELAGCGVVFKLVQALLKDIQKSEASCPAGFEKWFLDLVAMATVADICPLLDENRTLVKYGLIVLQKTRQAGIQALAQVARISLASINTDNIGFQLAPRLNAAGRIDHASTAYELLMTDDFKRALAIAQGLDGQNRERQKETDQIFELAKKQIGEVTDQKILFAMGKNWPVGIVGLVAGKLTDEFFRPALVLGKNQTGQIIGSGRSIAGFNITDALAKCQKFLWRYGGHFMACGFTLKETEFKNFKQAMQKIADFQLSSRDLRPVLKIDVEVPLREINWQLYDELSKFEPFGQGNPKPLFLVRGLAVAGLRPVGKDGKHLQIMVADTNRNIKKTIGFCFGDWCQRLKIGDIIDLVVDVDINVWNGNKELQLKILDIKSCNM